MYVAISRELETLRLRPRLYNKKAIVLALEEEKPKKGKLARVVMHFLPSLN